MKPMKLPVFAAVVSSVLAASAVISQEEFHELAKKKGKNEEERKAFREYITYQSMRQHGGVIEKANSRKGLVVVANAQKLVPAAEIEKAFEQFSRTLRIDIAVRDVSAEDAAASDAKAKLGANALVAVAELGDKPALVFVPDADTAIVNVSALAADKPAPEKLAERVRKEVVRAFAFVAGAAASQNPYSLTGVVHGVGELDSFKDEHLMIDVVQRLQKHLPAMGIVPAVRATYLKACEEGWAPAPTNEFQKAIFERVKADKERGPSNPIKIEPPKGGK